MKNISIKTGTAVSSSRIVNINSTPNLHQEGVAKHIAEAVYYKAEAHEFAYGHEIDDWLNAEKEILQ